MAKGGSFERELCYGLSRWWTGVPNQLVFWRTSNSGGGATVRHRKGVSNKAHAGDISAIEEVGRPLTELVTFEAKAGYSKKKSASGKSLHDLLDRTNQKSLYEDWIVQARTAADRAGTPFWMIVHRRDYRRTMAYFPSLLFAELSVRDCFQFRPPFVAMTVTVQKENISFVGMTLDNFLWSVDRADVLALTKERKTDG